MTARNDDRLLSAWLYDTAPTREPEHLLGQVLARTARTKRRPAWRIPERWLSMSAITSRFTPAAPVPWRVVLVTVALLLVAAIGFVLVSSGALRRSAPPYGLAANGPLYYSQNGEIYLRSAPAERAAAIVTGQTDDFAPVVSPDGAKVSFLRKVDDKNNALWAMNADGSNVHQLGVAPGPIGWFEWAPDGRSAAVLIDSDKTALDIVPADGSPLVRHDLGINLDQAYWLAPDGSRLGLLGSDLDGNRGVYVVNRDGTGLVRLALDPGFRPNDADYQNDAGFYFWTASWSARGDQLLYSQLEPDPASPAGPGFRIHLATIDSAGAVISDVKLEFARSDDDEFAPSWLPDGSGLVFQTVEGSRHALFSATLRGNVASPPRDLHVAANDWIGSQVSPDGRQLFVIPPVPQGAAPVVELLDLATLQITPVDVGDDVTWQRLPRMQ